MEDSAPILSSARHTLALVRLLAVATAFAACGARVVHASPPSIEDFAARPVIEDVTISPDGRHVALIKTHDGRGGALVMDRESNSLKNPHFVMGEPDHFRMTWCRWATDVRLLCGFRAMARSPVMHIVTRLAAVDADGGHVQVLIQNAPSAQGQYQDRIINWDPGPADTVLIEADEGLSKAQESAGVHVYGNVGTHALPAVFELNVRTGQLAIRQKARDPIRHWITDVKGHVRLGWGQSGKTESYFAKLDGDHEWRRLSKFDLFTRAVHFDPIAISGEDPNKAYAFASYEGRRALWLIDLADKEEPTLVFAHPAVDVDAPILAHDGHLIGVRYDPGHPMTYFVDEDRRTLNAMLQKLEPGKVSDIRQTTKDEQTYVVRSYDDMSPPEFKILDMKTLKALGLGAAYPERDVSSFAPMRSISYKARDGAVIPAYLSTPVGATGDSAPLIVMPHGGPIARDTWNYFFLRQFLVSRGYSVLQMNFRGSSGYGDDWFFAAHQDWGGLTYDDVVDGARWAVEQKIADPHRICIVGWSFGGYLALVGAQRNPDLFRCSVDIAGISDLGLLISEGQSYINGYDYRRAQLGPDPEKLKRDSPRRHAAEFAVPLLMLHGDMDAQALFEQSTDMDSALKQAGKPHRFVTFKDGDHQFSDVKDRALMLREIDKFLAENLPVNQT